MCSIRRVGSTSIPDPSIVSDPPSSHVCVLLRTDCSLLVLEWRTASSGWKRKERRGDCFFICWVHWQAGEIFVRPSSPVDIFPFLGDQSAARNPFNSWLNANRYFSLPYSPSLSIEMLAVLLLIGWSLFLNICICCIFIVWWGNLIEQPASLEVPPYPQHHILYYYYIDRSAARSLPREVLVVRFLWLDAHDTFLDIGSRMFSSSTFVCDLSFDLCSLLLASRRSWSCSGSIRTTWCFRLDSDQPPTSPPLPPPSPSSPYV